MNYLPSEVYPREPCIPDTHHRERETHTPLNEGGRDRKKEHTECVSDTEKRSEQSEPVTQSNTHRQTEGSLQQQRKQQERGVGQRGMLSG